MFGHRGPEHIVDPDEPVQEGGTVEKCHGDVPKGGNGQSQQDPPEQLHVGQGLEIPVPGQVGQDNQAGEHQTQRPFGQDGQTGQGIGSVIQTGPFFCLGQVEQHQGSIYGNKQGHVGDHRLGQVEIFHAGGHNETAEKSHIPAVQLLGEPVGLEHPDGAEDRREEPGGKGSLSKQPEGRQQFSVEHPGLVIPVVLVDPGGKPVTGSQHLLGGKGIVGFHRIGDQQLSVAGKEQHQAQQQKQESRPVPMIKAQQRIVVMFPIFHIRILPYLDGSSIEGNLKGKLNTIEGLIKEKEDSCTYDCWYDRKRKNKIRKIPSEPGRR